MITVEALNGTFTCYDNDWIVKEIQACGSFCRPELSMISSFLKSGDTLVDVGAHIGTFCIPLKKQIGEEGRLFAFEANPQTFELLQKNFTDNNVKADAFNKGVSSKKGTLYLKGRNLDARNQPGNAQNPLNSGADHLTDIKPQDSEFVTEVELVRIDDVIAGPVHFMKIDVEGMEISVLQSAEKTIDASRPIIYSEYFSYYLKRAGENPKTYEDFFKKRNYHFFTNASSRRASNDEFKLVRIPGPKYIRGQVDFLLIPADSDRYPKNFQDWKTSQPWKFLSNRIRNQLGSIKAAILKKP